MTKQQEAFLREYLVSGDKIAAYRLAYPNAKESSIKSAVNRLMRTNPDIEKAVRKKEHQLDKRAERKVLKQKERKHIAKYQLRELLANVIDGTELTEKIYHTREGFERQMVKPTVSQKIAAANACIRMEGWGRPQPRIKQEKDKKEAALEKETPPQILIGGLPMEEYTALYGNTVNAYFDPEEGSSKWWPLDIHMDRFMDRQKRRQERKDVERQQRMTPQLELEEQQAIGAFESRDSSEEGYQPQDKVIETLQDDYLETKNKDKLKELQAVQKMCGLRFLHHRHRYEAERDAGWEFHPLNNNLIRKYSPNRQQLSEVPQAAGLPPLKTTPIRQQKETTERSELMSMPLKNNEAMRITTNQGRHVERRDTSPEPVQTATSEPTTQASPTPKQPVQASSIPVQASSLEPPDHHALLKQGYQTLKELVQDEFDYYIRNQCSTTWKQKKDLERFTAHRNAPPEVRQQIEQETGWLYHPDYPYYAKRDPKRPLVRTRFKGPPRY